MGASFQLLRYAGQALLASLKVTTPWVTGLVEVLPQVAQELWKAWRKDTTDQQRRQELQAVAQMAAGELAHEVARILREVAPDRPQAERDQVALYLSQLPGTIRRSLRRPSDPAGRTVPSGLQLGQASDLLKFLPQRLPRFQKGDRPLPGANWELEELLGAGGFGEVWKARNPDFDAVPPVALKFCLDEQAAPQLLREARVVGRALQGQAHPGIVQLRNVHASPACLEYEYVGGGDLGGLIRDWHDRNRPPAPRKAAAVIRELARAVGFAHEKGIVHRDLKPANVLVQAGPTGEPLFKVGDFGIGAAVRRGQAEEGVTRAGWAPYFTEGYASRQVIDGGDPDPRDDVYALGVIWYEMLTGVQGRGRPGGLHWAEDLRRREVSDSMLLLLASCFEDDPDRRPRDGHDLARRLEQELGDPRSIPVATVAEVIPPEVRRPVPEERPARRRERPKWLAGLGAGVALAAILLGVGLIWRPFAKSSRGAASRTAGAPFVGTWEHNYGKYVTRFEFRDNGQVRHSSYSGAQLLSERTAPYQWDGAQLSAYLEDVYPFHLKGQSFTVVLRGEEMVLSSPSTQFVLRRVGGSRP